MDLTSLMIWQSLARYGIDGAVVRRWFTVFCAATFILTNVVHSATCADSSAKAATSEVAFSMADDNGDASSLASMDADHCHGCAAVSIPVIAAYVSPVADAKQIKLAAAYRFDADQRPSDPPPPRILT